MAKIRARDDSEQDMYDEELERHNHMGELAQAMRATVATGPLAPPALNPDGSEKDPTSNRHHEECDCEDQDDRYDEGECEEECRNED